ncbi:MAG: hypothetical protein RL172_3206 [Bacteroidota bacterium]
MFKKNSLGAEFLYRLHGWMVAYLYAWLLQPLLHAALQIRQQKHRKAAGCPDLYRPLLMYFLFRVHQRLPLPGWYLYKNDLVPVLRVITEGLWPAEKKCLSFF